MRAFLNTKKGMIVAAAAGLAVVLAAGWLLVVAPERKQADELAAKVTASQVRARGEEGRARAAERTGPRQGGRSLPPLEGAARPDRLGRRAPRPRPAREDEQADALGAHPGAAGAERRHAPAALHGGARGQVHERLEVPARGPQARGHPARAPRASRAACTPSTRSRSSSPQAGRPSRSCERP